MPIYEFLCNHCQERTSLFVRRLTESLSTSCPACGSEDLTRLFSAFAYHKSLETIHEEAGEADRPGPGYYKDPRNIGRWAEKRFQEMGLEMPSQVQEMIQASREGELPQPVKELQPGLKEV